MQRDDSSTYSATMNIYPNFPDQQCESINTMNINPNFPNFPDQQCESINEHLKCPRCESINTKFCYYTNYSLSQPRHFCKNCRRYWTKGGTLRNIPIGGGTRKNTKRSNSSPSSSNSLAVAPPVSQPKPEASGINYAYGDDQMEAGGGGSFSSLLGSTPGGHFAKLLMDGLSPTLVDGSNEDGLIRNPSAEEFEGRFLTMNHKNNNQRESGGESSCWPDLSIYTPVTGNCSIYALPPEEWDAREIDLSNNIISELPDKPNCPILVNLFLHSNEDLMDIPITFFDHMPNLQVLDFSSTSINHLPSSISKLTNLRKLFMRDCDLLMELPPEIGALRNLKVFDAEGTQLICLPEQFRWLTKLECLKFSLYCCADRYKASKQIVQIIPATALSKLVRLKELSISVDSYGEWWEDEAKLVMDVLSKVRHLESLKLYFPTSRLLHIFMEQQNWEGVPIYPYLSNFSFIVGHVQQRLISRIPLDLEKMFLQLPKCLKYTNGGGDTEVIKMALKHAHTLFLDRHWTIQSLSTFGAAEMEKLRFCLLAECNEMLEIFKGSHFYEAGGNGNEEGSSIRPVLVSLEYLAVHYMKSLSCIWKGPILSGCLVNLKTLAMHACPELKTILTPGLLDNLTSLEYLIVEDCPQIKSIVTSGSHHSTSTQFLPRLKKISLIYLPELVSISCGISIAPRLESLVIYDCPNLEKLSDMEVSGDILEIKGENEWWDALKWCEPEWTGGRPDYLADVFVPLGTDDDIMDELADAVNFPPHLSD